jgi:hypothetical protein
MNVNLYDLADLRRRGIRASADSLRRWEAVHRFPRRVRLSRYKIYWIQSEIDEYLEELASDREVGQ